MSVAATVLPDPASGLIVVVLRGELTLESVGTVRGVLLKCFAQFPDAVVVDLHELRADTPARLTVFPAAVRAHGAPATLLFCCAPPQLAAMIQDRRFGDIARYDTREGAVSAVRAARVHPVRRVSAHLAPTPAAPGTARELVEGACRSWGVGYLAGPATVVVSELVSNAVQHAGTDLKVIVALRGGYLHVSVQDGSPDPPMVTDLGARGGALVPERGRGLHLIKGYAVAWGSTPTDGGKTVWATLRVAPS